MSAFFIAPIMDEIKNKVAESKLVTIDLDDLHTPGKRVVYDMAQHLFEGLILREKDFRAQLAEADLTPYHNAHVAITCTADAIVPMWAFMAVAAVLQPVAQTVVFGTADDLERALATQKLATLQQADYIGKPVIIRGCSRFSIHPSVYVQLTAMLRPVAHRIMYGEACSTVPVYRKGGAAA